MVQKAIRKAIGKQPGDMVSVTIKVDNENRVDPLPEGLKSFLSQNPEAEQFFNGLTASQKNTFIRYITSAKREDTVARRIKRVTEMVAHKEKIR
jgi:uncharacterized protein YdeI (YjbR/CyaY-like superfamily)